MKLEIEPNGVWYQGSNVIFDVLRKGSTVTQWRAPAEAFSHKPTELGYDDNGIITHNGKEKGFLYIIDEPITVDHNICHHPGRTIDKNAEFLTKRPLKVKLIKTVI